MREDIESLMKETVRGACGRLHRRHCNRRFSFDVEVCFALLCGLAALAASPASAKPTLSGVSAVSGGAIANDGEGGISSPTFTNVTFSGNNASGNGGAMYNHGNTGGTSNAMLTNVTFSGNHADSKGGAIYNHADSGTSTPLLVNVILWGDTAPSGSEIYNVTAFPVFAHSIVQGSGGSGGGWHAGLGIDFGNNLDADPVLGALADNGGNTQTLLPGVGSAAVDSGDDSECPAADQRGVARPQRAHCDIGSVEVRPDVVFANGFDGI